MAYLTVASFGFLAIFLAAQLLGHTEHDGRAASRSREQEQGAESGERRLAPSLAATSTTRFAATPSASRASGSKTDRDRVAASGRPRPMKLQMIGCSHHNASLALRERLAFNPAQAAGGARPLAATVPRRRGRAAFDLQSGRTLHRLGDRRAEGRAISRLPSFWPSFTGWICLAIFDDLFEQSGEAAVRHLFNVAASLDSMVLGEPQILAQVKQAYRAGPTAAKRRPADARDVSSGPARGQARGERNVALSQAGEHRQRRRRRFRPATSSIASTTSKC